MGRGIKNASPLKVRGAKSIAGNSLAIARVLADQDGVTFRSDGTCMYPTIRPGDVLHIQQRAAIDVRVGDIAVVRRSKNLLSHRVVARGTEQGRAFIVTRSDRARQGEDSPTFDEDLLGIVESIERRGRFVPLDRARPSWPARLWYGFRLRLIEVRLRVLPWWSVTLARLQDTPIYRRLAGLWLGLARPRISYAVRVPVPALGDAVFRQMKPEDFNVEKDWRGRPVKRWMLTLHLNDLSQPAAWMTFERKAADAWALDEWYVCARYRGAGLEERLLSRAGGILPPGSIGSP
ncbi:MAG: S24/S26 family peptidase [Proteobacteria bacterium]|nr:S24/S26 family peptidase [Pseudomonadota bacterium]